MNQRAETPFLRDGRGGNKSSGWRWACIELRKMANRASIGKVSQRGLACFEGRKMPNGNTKC